ncbi:DnaJ C-terminal domain-containing protein [Youngiibacter multivorans]|uniref:Curved DNA-binding protein n=1 Tax=Youngiibacter multivorans TaxID=937251 RepID=A0ABS4FZF7_9CLOT|nr:DnaJ C-terminal domain-containing protein [Youngiibacter multivorans]MBP1917677.1 curved DNA-binding protein [Youngiibacter multivorans]
MGANYKDYYEILGVDRKASEAEIKTAYLKAARKHHPDLHIKSEKAASEEKFKEINEAYAVLGDKEKRASYDSLGENLHSGQEWQPSPDMGSYGSQSWSSEEAEGFSDFFESLFGQARSNNPYGGFRQTRSIRGQDLESELELTLEEAYHGGQKLLQFSFRGTGNKTIVKSLDVKIPPFVRDKSKIRLKGQGGEGLAGGLAGDLLLTVKILPNAKFKLNGDSLETTIKIRPEQAVLGSQVHAPTIDGQVMITIPPMTHNGQKLRLRSKGWLGRDGIRGDEYVQVIIDIPRSINQSEKEQYERLADLNEGVH